MSCIGVCLSIEKNKQILHLQIESAHNNKCLYLLFLLVIWTCSKCRNVGLFLLKNSICYGYTFLSLPFLLTVDCFVQGGVKNGTCRKCRNVGLFLLKFSICYGYTFLSLPFCLLQTVFV